VVYSKRQAQVAINVWLGQLGSLLVNEKNCREKRTVNINANVDLAGQSEGVDHCLTMPH
tara:strand:- start:182 stop:358 length:177 start_codon:yes stop_codon:yes gene_type:complete